MTVENKLKISSILRKSSKISIANVLGYLLSVPVQIYVARALGPANYGIVGYIAVWQTYCALTKPGFVSALSREIPHYLGNKDFERLGLVQRVAISSEISYTLVPFAVLIGAAILHDSSDVAFGFILTAFTLLFNTCVDTLTTLHWSNQRFRAITINKYIQSFLYPLLTFVFVHVFELRGVFLANLCFSVLSSIQLFILTPKLHYSFGIERGTLRYLLKLGVMLQLGSFLYAFYATLDRTIVASVFGMTALGLYTFVYNVRFKAFGIITDFGNVLRPVFWSEMGAAGDTKGLNAHVFKISLILVAAAGVLANCAQAGFGFVVDAFLPKYLDAVPVLELAMFTLSLGAASLMFENVLLSKMVNKVIVSSLTWLVGIVVAGGIAYALLYLYPDNILLVPMAFICGGAIVFMTNMLVAWRYVFDSPRQFIRYVLLVAGLLILQAVVYLLLRQIDLFATSWSNLALKIGLVTLVWGSLAVVGYRLAPFLKRLLYAA